MKILNCGYLAVGTAYQVALILSFNVFLTASC